MEIIAVWFEIKKIEIQSVGKCTIFNVHKSTAGLSLSWSKHKNHYQLSNECEMFRMFGRG
jgi:hypothetical protein